MNLKLFPQRPLPWTEIKLQERSSVVKVKSRVSTHMSYSSLPAVAVRSAFRSMVYISYYNTDQTRGSQPPLGPLEARHPHR